MASTLLTFAAFMKEVYTDETVEDLTQKDHPLTAMVPKDTNGTGKQMIVPLILTNPQGVASTIADAQTAATNLDGKFFTLTFGLLSASVSIGLEVLLSSKSNKGAFFANQKAETDGIYSQMGDTLSLALWSDYGQSIGRRGSLSGNIVTLLNPADVANFEIGMTIEASEHDGTGASDDLRAGSTTVTVVNRAEGKITLANAAAITSFTDNDYLFRFGTFMGNTGKKITAGVQAYIAATETPGNLHGMVRTSDPVKLAGCRVPSADINGMGLEDRLRTLGGRMTGRYRAKGADRVFLNPEDWESLAISLGARGYRSLTDESTRFGFQKLQMALGGKFCDIFADTDCPKGTAFVLAMKSWTLYSISKLIMTVDQDGLEILRGSNTHTFEYRLVSLPGLVCRAPGNNGRVSLT